MPWSGTFFPESVSRGRFVEEAPPITNTRYGWVRNEPIPAYPVFGVNRSCQRPKEFERTDWASGKKCAGAPIPKLGTGCETGMDEWNRLRGDDVLKHREIRESLGDNQQAGFTGSLMFPCHLASHTGTSE